MAAGTGELARKRHWPFFWGGGDMIFFCTPSPPEKSLHDPPLNLHGLWRFVALTFGNSVVDPKLFLPGPDFFFWC